MKVKKITIHSVNIFCDIKEKGSTLIIVVLSLKLYNKKIVIKLRNLDS